MAVHSRSFKVDESAYSVAFSPFQHSSSLLAVGGESKITVKAISLGESTFQNSETLLQALAVQDVLDLHLSVRSTCLSWSPSSSHEDKEHSRLVLCAAGADHKLRLISKQLDNAETVVMEGHMGYINDISCHPSGRILASVGDDKLCRLWDLEVGLFHSSFRLTSPGVSVCWHQEDPHKLLVAEKNGRVRLYDITMEMPVMTLDVPTPPLMSADWSPSNSLRVGGVANGNWCLWDTSRSSQPLEVRNAHQTAATKFRWCCHSDQVFATIGCGSQLKVHHVEHQRVPIVCDLPVATDLSWHSRLPVLAVSSDRCVRLWSVEV